MAYLCHKVIFATKKPRQLTLHIIQSTDSLCNSRTEASRVKKCIQIVVHLNWIELIKLVEFINMVTLLWVIGLVKSAELVKLNEF